MCFFIFNFQGERGFGEKGAKGESINVRLICFFFSFKWLYCNLNKNGNWHVVEKYSGTFCFVDLYQYYLIILCRTMLSQEESMTLLKKVRHFF